MCGIFRNNSEASIEKEDCGKMDQEVLKKELDYSKLTHGTIAINKIVELVRKTDAIIFDEKAAADVTVKGAADYVTKVDVAVQEFLKKELAELYPAINFIGEEQKRFQTDPHGSYWILDPIDGTTNLIHHYGMSAVSLGLYEKGRMTFGVVYNPFHRELFVAALGQGAYLNRKKIQVSAEEKLSDALIAYGSSPYEKDRAAGLFDIFQRIFLAAADFRRSGSAALDLCYVACGRQEAYIEQNLKPWDYAAGALILQEAGGSVGTWVEQETLPYLENADVCATNGKLEQAIRKLLS
jgi:myo-inositol-1(or 4)-monophosphatase